MSRFASPTAYTLNCGTAGRGCTCSSPCETTAFRSALHRVRCAQCAFAANSARLPPLPLPPQTEPVFLRSPAGFRLNEPNVLPLDRAALWLDEELLCAQDEILKLDRTLRGRLGMEQRSGEMLQPWARKGPDTSYPIRLCFSVLCEQLPQTPLLLALEDLPAQTLTVNGMAISLCKAGRLLGRFLLFPLRTSGSLLEAGRKSDRVDCSVFRGSADWKRRICWETLASGSVPEHR